MSVYQLSVVSINICFRNTLLCLALKQWADNENLRESLPAFFRPIFPNSVSDIDGSYILVAKYPESHSTVNTNYKLYNITQCIFGITSHGNISFFFISWGGNRSDKLLLKQ
ncbi:hypothetical protein LSH36_242g00005 [Paralvinella palmiformis]|uniref:DDE Tnp4 domain-containing protein n=1 Tax=Paralvinella palmiformis TaxID=53620 RepID=A0AAD9JLC6_9ANNE|nr:hypothetical protein LSH36_242g00005 [Paralvinella palmiformis]